MRRVLVSMLLVMSSLASAAADPQDVAGSSDPALFTRMKGFSIYRYEVKDFDRFEVPVAVDRKEAVEGRHVYVDYYAKDGITLPSPVQIVRNYTNAAKVIGGSAVYEYEDGGVLFATIRVVKGDAEVWALVEGAGNGMYKVHVVEKALMKQDVEANADALAGSLKATGKVAVYGILFDTDKADLKPASEPALVEIARLLKAEPKLQLYVVGHTDNQGAFAHNVKLSQARAAAVVSALVKKHAVAAARLTAFGAGPTSPVASNADEGGRARNRRVELVAQ